MMKSYEDECACIAESLASWPALQGLSGVFERRRQVAEHERIALLETLLILQSDGATALPADAWLQLASGVAGALYARGPSADPAQARATAKAQQLVSSASCATPSFDVASRLRNPLSSHQSRLS